MTKSDVLGVIKFIIIASFILSGILGFFAWILLTIVGRGHP